MSAECGAVLVAVEAPAVNCGDDFCAGIGTVEIQSSEEVVDVLCRYVLQAVGFVVLECCFEFVCGIDAFEAESFGCFVADAWKGGEFVCVCAVGRETS